MPKAKIFSYLNNIEGEPTAHLTGLKKVFLNNQDTESALTQFAYGLFKPNEKCELHIHPSMIECFFFIKGNGKYMVEDQVVNLQPDTFLQIPPNTPHELINDGNEDLEFVYFGIATD